MDCKFILFLSGNAQKDLFHFQSSHVVLCQSSFLSSTFHIRCQLAFNFFIIYLF